ncbi:MAG: hemin uptake protein HemP [Pirellulaceae bacterium]
MTDTKKESRDDQAVELNLPKIISFNSLVRCGDEVWIENEGQIYRLRRTKQGKLILTK